MEFDWGGVSRVVGTESLPPTVLSGEAAGGRQKGRGQGIDHRESSLQPNRKWMETNNLQLKTYKTNVVPAMNKQ